MKVRLKSCTYTLPKKKKSTWIERFKWPKNTETLATTRTKPMPLYLRNERRKDFRPDNSAHRWIRSAGNCKYTVNEFIR